MAIPVFHQIMLPLLQLLEDKQEHSLRQVIDSLTNHFNLTQEEQHELLPSGKQAVFDNRVGWARTHLKKAGLLESTKRGFFRITDRGLQVLNQKPAKIDVKFLDQFAYFGVKKPGFRRKPAGLSEQSRPPFRTKSATLLEGRWTARGHRITVGGGSCRTGDCPCARLKRFSG